MADWTVPVSYITGKLITAAIWNDMQGVDGNAAALREGKVAIASQAAGDVIFASSSTQLDTLAIGTANKVLTSSGSAPQWSTQIVNAALPTNIDVGGTLDVTGATTLDGTLDVAGAVVFNDAGADIDFRVEGDTAQNLLFVDASTDRVGLGTASPSQVLHIYNGNLLIGNGGTDDVTIGVDGGGTHFNKSIIPNTTDAYALGTSSKKWNAFHTNAILVYDSAIFNEDSGDFDFRVESNGNANMLFVDGGEDRVGIGTNAPDAPLEIQGAEAANEPILHLNNSVDADYTQGVHYMSPSMTANNISPV